MDAIGFLYLCLAVLLVVAFGEAALLYVVLRDNQGKDAIITCLRQSNQDLQDVVQRVSRDEDERLLHVGV
jgi:hypothetical protein